MLSSKDSIPVLDSEQQKYCLEKIASDLKNISSSVKELQIDLFYFSKHMEELVQELKGAFHEIQR